MRRHGSFFRNPARATLGPVNLNGVNPVKTAFERMLVIDERRRTIRETSGDKKEYNLLLKERNRQKEILCAVLLPRYYPLELLRLHIQLEGQPNGLEAAQCMLGFVIEYFRDYGQFPSPSTVVSTLRWLDEEEPSDEEMIGEPVAAQYLNFS